MPWAAWKASAMGMIVVVSALFPSQQPRVSDCLCEGCDLSLEEMRL